MGPRGGCRRFVTSFPRGRDVTRRHTGAQPEKHADQHACALQSTEEPNLPREPRRRALPHLPGRPGPTPLAYVHPAALHCAAWLFFFSDRSISRDLTRPGRPRAEPPRGRSGHGFPCALAQAGRHGRSTLGYKARHAPGAQRPASRPVVSCHSGEIAIESSAPFSGGLGQLAKGCEGVCVRVSLLVPRSVALLFPHVLPCPL